MNVTGFLIIFTCCLMNYMFECALKITLDVLLLHKNIHDLGKQERPKLNWFMAVLCPRYG